MHQNCCIHCSMSNVAKNISNNWCRICLFVTVNKRNTSPLWLAASVIDLKLQEYIITVFKNCILLINQFLINQSIIHLRPPVPTLPLHLTTYVLLGLRRLSFMGISATNSPSCAENQHECFLHETLIINASYMKH